MRSAFSWDPRVKRVDDRVGEHVLSSGDILRFAVPLRVGVRGDVHRVTNASVHRR